MTSALRLLNEKLVVLTERAGFLEILSWPPGATSFDVFQNLTTVNGNQLLNKKWAIAIKDNGEEQLEKRLMNDVSSLRK